MKRSKRTVRKAKDIAIKAITYISGIVFMISICSVDSDSWIPIIALILSGMWLTYYAWACGYFCVTNHRGDR